MAVLATRAAVGPEGFLAMISAFGAVPRPVRAAPSTSMFACARAIDQVVEGIAKKDAKWQTTFRLKYRKDSKADGTTAVLCSRPAESPVLAYQTKSNEWKGSFKFGILDVRLSWCS